MELCWAKTKSEGEEPQAETDWIGVDARPRETPSRDHATVRDFLSYSKTGERLVVFTCFFATAPFPLFVFWLVTGEGEGKMCGQHAKQISKAF